jgi:glycosyltransferase involved in cell wall biosynthesis
VLRENYVALDESRPVSMNDEINAKPFIASRPKLSVCMASYNGERFISRQLQTILSQLLPDDEVIISDDSSTDGTLEIIRAINDSRIHLYSGQTFRSPIYNFEHALKQASGEVIFLSDQDDEWIDGWVETALTVLRNVSLVVCDADMIDAEGKVRPSSEAKIYLGGTRKPGVIHNLYRNGYIGCCCAFRREVLEEALPFPDKLPWHDWWIGMVADVFFSTKFISERKIRYRRHGANVSPTGEVSKFSLSKKIRMRLNLAKALLIRRLTR